MDEHGKHFIAGAGDALIPVPEFGCPECKTGDSTPIDWPARFRTAADAAEKRGAAAGAAELRDFANKMFWAPPDVVEAIGRALLGESS